MQRGTPPAQFGDQDEAVSLTRSVPVGEDITRACVCLYPHKSLARLMRHYLSFWHSPDYDPQFEELISSTIEETKDIPEIISETGKIGMPHKGPCADSSSFCFVY